MPSEHDCPDTQMLAPVPALPQPPQLLGSVLVLVHAPLQSASGSAPQVQVPALQNWPLVQALPHEPASRAPQLLLSDSGFTQLPPQSMSVRGHEVTHLPNEHTWAVLRQSLPWLPASTEH